jgi:hypothetical protein
MRPLLALALTSLLAGCATFDEVEGVPDSLDWSYFHGTPAQVAESTRDVLTVRGFTVDAMGAEAGGRYLLRVTSTPPGADFQEVLIEPTSAEGFGARAQTSPRGDRLPRDLEIAIGAELPLR